MEQQSEPNASHQVIYIIQAPKEKVNIKDAYNVKAATVLGVIHILCGFIALGAEIAGMVDGNFSVGTGIWTSVLFFVSGGLAIGGARSGNKCLVVATMVMAIISAISAGILLIMSAIHLGIGSRYRGGRYMGGMEPVTFGLLIAMGASMLIVAIASASLTCYPLCCRSTKQGTVHYNPNNQMAAANLSTVQDLKAHPSTSVQLLSEPPTYQDVVSFTNPLASGLSSDASGNLSDQNVARVGSNYQKF